MSIDGLVTKNKFLLESIHRIDTHIDVVVEVIKVGSSVSFDFCLDEEFIEPCWDAIIFQSPHDTNFVYFPSYSGGSFLLVGTKLVGSRGFGASF